jgi:Domain of unknown function (DUF5753)
LILPGLLQTREYAREILRAFEKPPETLDRSVELRMRRQGLLDASPGPDFAFMIDEAALHRWVGGPDVMRRQLHRLEELDQRPNIDIRIVPFSAGAHAGVRGPFALIDLPFGEEYVVMLEHAHGDELVQNNPERASTYIEIFEELRAIAAPKGELPKYTKQILNQLPPADSASDS